MTTVFDQSTALAGTDDGDGNSNVNVRVVIPASLQTAASGTQCQITLLFGTAEPTETPAIDSVWFGQKGASAPDFDGTQVQVKFSGGSTVNGSAAGVVISDVFTLSQTWDATKDHVCAFHVHNGANGALSAATIAGAEIWFGAGTDDSSSTHSTTATTNAPTFHVLVETIFVTAGAAAKVPFNNYFAPMLASKRKPMIGWREGYDHRWRRWRRERGILVRKKVILRAA